MRQLVLDRIIECVNAGLDLNELEFCPPTSLAALPTLTDAELLDIYSEAIGFNG